MDNNQETKNSLRSFFKEQRKAFAEAHKDTPFEKQFLNTFKDYVCTHDIELQNLIVSSYYLFGDEASPLGILDYLLDQKIKVALPKMEEDEVVFCQFEKGDSLQKNNFGFYEPVSGNSLDPDLLIVSLLAFDQTGHRLGYGKGHYDRALEKLFKKKTPHLIGLAYPCQATIELPFEEHDQKLNAVLLPDMFIDF